MANRCVLLYFAAILYLSGLVWKASALTDNLDVAALLDLYVALNSPPQLSGWNSSGGDPCKESWKGVSCFGSSVIHVKLHGLELTGHLGFQLSNLHNLKELDVSSNKIQGDIPYSLPLNATHINLACNNLSSTIPSTLTSMGNLRHLNLSHNSMSGPIGNVFDSLENLKEMDLSFNNFTGDLPTSVASLRSLNRLFLQNNRFTGSVILLADLPLSDLNIQDNDFSGIIPNQFQRIHNLWFGGNLLMVGAKDPPWSFPLENMPANQNISSPPTTESNAIGNYNSRKLGKHRKRGIGPAGVACLVAGATFLVICAALAIIIRLQSRAKKPIGEFSNEFSQHSFPLTTVEDHSGAAQEIPRISVVCSPVVATRHTPPVQIRPDKLRGRRSFCKLPRDSISAKVYTLVELQAATEGFSDDKLLGEGSLGCVHKAEFPDGQVAVVKNINTIALSLQEEEKFLDVIWNVDRLRHPNIVTLLGYCVEHGQHLLVYEYSGSLTLEKALHCQAYTPFSWSLRLRIALGVARAMDYLHSTSTPPVAHCNLKAANILLDEELMPRVADCGLAILRPLTSNSVKVKASEMAIGDTGYAAPESQHGINSFKSDIYACGVLLLELLTGKRPFDSSRPTGEQSLVKWAMYRLHDSESLEKMIDPTIKRTISTRALSRFADIISVCIQPEKEFRPSMSQVVESLTACLNEKGGHAAAAEVVVGDRLERSFRSTHTRFFASPGMMSYSSI